MKATRLVGPLPNRFDGSQGIVRKYDITGLEVAATWAKLGTCSRLKVGACILDENSETVTTGYNGAARTLRHCNHENDGDMENGHCAVAIHAEMNALLQAARQGRSVKGATLYLTHAPCYPCTRHVIQAGIRRVVFGAMYRLDERAMRDFDDAGVVVDFIEDPKDK